MSRDIVDTPPFVTMGHVEASGRRVEDIRRAAVGQRRGCRMHHLGIGIQHAGKRVLALADDTTVTAIHLDTGEILSQHQIDPERSYWRNQQRSPGRWPGLS